jgi:mRNA interferase HigB
MRIIKRKTLIQFYQQDGHRDAKQPLLSWFAETKTAEWKSPSQIKQQYRTASILRDNRIVFNIGGNKYRLVVKVHYNTGIVFIRFIGTHEEYDKINAEEI